MYNILYIYIYIYKHQSSFHQANLVQNKKKKSLRQDFFFTSRSLKISFEALIPTTSKGRTGILCLFLHWFKWVDHLFYSSLP